VATITAITKARLRKRFRKLNGFNEAAKKTRQKIPGEGIFYHPYIEPCTIATSYPSQIESVEIPTNFGNPTATRIPRQVQELQ
jgi:hypothetical protein